MPSENSRSETLARLAASRAEIERAFEPDARTSASHSVEDGTIDDGDGGAFPRSRTMRMLLSGRGVGTLGAVLGGLAMARPRLAFRLLRMLPTGAVGRMLVVKAVAMLRSKADRRP